MVQRKRRSIIKMAKLPPAVLDVLREEPEVAIPVAVVYRGYQSYQGINSIYEHITGQDNNTIHDTGSLPENFDYKSLNNANTYIASGPPPRFATHAPQPEDVSAEEKKPLIPPAGGTNNVSGPGPEDTTIDILPSSRGTDNAPTLRRRPIRGPPPPEQVPLVRSRGFNGSYGQSRGPFPNIGNATTALGAAGLAAAVVASNLGGGGVTPSTDVPPTTQDPLIPFTPPEGGSVPAPVAPQDPSGNAGPVVSLGNQNRGLGGKQLIILRPDGGDRFPSFLTGLGFGSALTALALAAL